MKKIVLAASAAAALALSACAATPTPYQPLGYPGARATGGFAEQQLEANRFRVTFAGNSYTDRHTVENGLLLRAAELTLAQGYDWFTAVERDTEAKTRYRDFGFNSGPRFGHHPYFWPSYRYYGRFGWSPFYDPWAWDRDVDLRAITRYEATAEIVMGRGPRPAGDPRAFDAREVQARVGPLVPRPYYAGPPVARY